ncbi:hypothetical protein [Nocardia sp. CA-290969]|uniref:hypothetical protein n=1 Tax=Nocardia sp. CA-290969 TaxID=3239986 RepID=UPI003D91FA58
MTDGAKLVLKSANFDPNVVNMLPINEATAAVVRDAIAKADQTEESVAEGARIEPRTWQRRIQGRTAFRVNELSRISAVLGVKMATLLTAISETVSQGSAKR